MPYYNVHSHIFTMSNAPEKFLHLYMPEVAANIVDMITRTKAGAKSLSWLLSKLPSNVAKRYASFLRIGKSNNPADVFEILLKEYNDPEVKFIVLTMFMEECGAGKSQTLYQGQLDQVVEVQRRYPGRLLAFLGVDPRWTKPGQTLLEIVQENFQLKVPGTSLPAFVGIKLYPSTGFYAFDKKLMATMEWAADNDIPVLSHCSYMGGIYNNDTGFIKGYLNTEDPYNNNQQYPAAYQGGTNFLKWLIGTNTSSNNLKTCSYFLEPESFRSMLQALKKKGKDLKLCLAHYGGGEHILAEHGKKTIDENKLCGIRKQNWCGQIKDLMKEFPKVCTDISYAVHDPEVHKVILPANGDPDFVDRIMFGTDFFLSEREKKEKDIYQAFLQKANKKIFSTGKTGWQQLASDNVEVFLNSKLYKTK